MTLVPLDIPAGFYRNGTAYAASGSSNAGTSGSVNQPGTNVQPGRGGSGAIIANHYEVNT
jgi:hypothetical protein